MRRKNRRSFNNEEMEPKKLVMISISVLIIAILAFVITYVVYSNYLNKSVDISEFDAYPITDLGKTNEMTSSEASSSIGKTVNEMQESTNEVTNTEKVAINTAVASMTKEVNTRKR